MAKQEIRQKQTHIAGRNGSQGHQVENTVTLDDNCLPPASELLQYKEIDPNIISFIIETTKKEQDFRHDFERRKLSVFNRGGRRDYMINWWGLCFAFILMVVGLGLSALLIYKDKIVVGSIFAGAALALIASIFIRRGSGNIKK